VAERWARPKRSSTNCAPTGTGTIAVIATTASAANNRAARREDAADTDHRNSVCIARDVTYQRSKSSCGIARPGSDAYSDRTGRQDAGIGSGPRVSVRSLQRWHPSMFGFDRWSPWFFTSVPADAGLRTRCQDRPRSRRGGCGGQGPGPRAADDSLGYPSSADYTQGVERWPSTAVPNLRARRPVACRWRYEIGHRGHGPNPQARQGGALPA
jgi:hypothetical protein